MSKRFSMFATMMVFLVGLVSLASAQSLVDVAKKEKDRRAKLGEKTDAPVITDSELNSYSSLPTSSSAPAPTEGEAAVEGEAAAAGSATLAAEAEEKEIDESKTREYWQKRVETAQKKVQDLEERLASPEMNWSGGVRTDVNPLGQRNLSQRQDLERQLEQARAELRAIEDEARRAGVPAGWVR